jgi:hypothetical protein
MPPARTIAVAMSGGVDSSTVAAMLRSEGHQVIGLTMQLWNQRRLAGRTGMPESVQGRCCSLDDVYDARRVAETLGIPYYVVNQEDRFERDVVRPFVEEYLSGRTPIPCSLCNNHLKFDQLLTVEQLRRIESALAVLAPSLTPEIVILESGTLGKEFESTIKAAMHLAAGKVMSGSVVARIRRVWAAGAISGCFRISASSVWLISGDARDRRSRQVLDARSQDLPVRLRSPRSSASAEPLTLRSNTIGPPTAVPALVPSRPTT